MEADITQACYISVLTQLSFTSTLSLATTFSSPSLCPSPRQSTFLESNAVFLHFFSSNSQTLTVWLYARPQNTSLVTKDFLMTKCKPFLPSQSCTIIPLARQALLVENSPLGFYFCLS